MSFTTGFSAKNSKISFFFPPLPRSTTVEHSREPLHPVEGIRKFKTKYSIWAGILIAGGYWGRSMRGKTIRCRIELRILCSLYLGWPFISLLILTSSYFKKWLTCLLCQKAFYDQAPLPKSSWGAQLHVSSHLSIYSSHYIGHLFTWVSQQTNTF